MNIAPKNKEREQKTLLNYCANIIWSKKLQYSLMNYTMNEYTQTKSDISRGSNGHPWSERRGVAAYFASANAKQHHASRRGEWFCEAIGPKLDRLTFDTCRKR